MQEPGTVSFDPIQPPPLQTWHIVVALLVFVVLIFVVAKFTRARAARNAALLRLDNTNPDRQD